MNIKFTEEIWSEIKTYTKSNDFLIITDKNVYDIYIKEFENITPETNRVFILSPGEKSKSIENLSSIYDKLLELNISREGYIISLGGGVVGDIAGFAAATYKRGINYIQIPTTLLSQVDSSVGGKTAIDFGGYKNAIGAFYFPEKVYIQTKFINTLDEREILSGLGEIIKYGLIYDYDIFIKIKMNIEEIFNRNLNLIEELIRESVEIKSKIVEEDQLDLGIRRILNFGHTIGHAIESYNNYLKYSHGEAVIKGMIYESRISYNRNLISQEYMDEIEHTLRPLVREESYNEDMVDELIKYMNNDKKNKNGKIGFVLPIDKALVDLFYDVSEREIKKAILGVD